jgi:hypothetical protein
MTVTQKAAIGSAQGPRQGPKLVGGFGQGREPAHLLHVSDAAPREQAQAAFGRHAFQP